MMRPTVVLTALLLLLLGYATALAVEARGALQARSGAAAAAAPPTRLVLPMGFPGRGLGMNRNL